MPLIASVAQCGVLNAKLTAKLHDNIQAAAAWDSSTDEHVNALVSACAVSRAPHRQPAPARLHAAASPPRA